MENAKNVVNVRGTLRAMSVGETLTLYNVRGGILRSTASSLKECGMLFKVNKKSDGYCVTRL